MSGETTEEQRLTSIFPYFVFTTANFATDFNRNIARLSIPISIKIYGDQRFSKSITTCARTHAEALPRTPRPPVPRSRGTSPGCRVRAGGSDTPRSACCWHRDAQPSCWVGSLPRVCSITVRPPALDHVFHPDRSAAMTVPSQPPQSCCTQRIRRVPAPRKHEIILNQ